MVGITLGRLAMRAVLSVLNGKIIRILLIQPEQVYLGGISKWVLLIYLVGAFFHDRVSILTCHYGALLILLHYLKGSRFLPSSPLL